MRRKQNSEPRAVPSETLSAFPEGCPVEKVPLKEAVRSSLPCAHNSSGSVGDRIQIIPPSIDELPSSADLLPVIPACAAFPHYLLSVIYSFTRRFSVHFICTTMSISLSFSSRSLWFSSSRAFLQCLSMLIVFVPLTPRQQPPFPASTSFYLNI